MIPPVNLNAIVEKYFLDKERERMIELFGKISSVYKKRV